MTTPNDALPAVPSNGLLGCSLIRIPLWKRWELAKRTGMDRACGHPRDIVGPFVQAMFIREGWHPPMALLPLFGPQWPSTVIERCITLESQYARVLHKHNTKASYSSPESVAATKEKL